MCQEPAIITFSHLRWNFVYQRPQHVLSRLAQKRRVLFIEEPVHDPSGVLSWERSEPEPNVSVCLPLTPVRASGFTDEQTPHSAGVIYDCMDELSAFPGVSPQLLDQLLEREEQLLQRADLVFTGGPS